MRCPHQTPAFAAAALLLVGAAAEADVVTGVSIHDYSSQLGAPYNRVAAHTIDGSGLVGGNHSNEPDAGSGTMWLSVGAFGGFGYPPDPLPVHITFDLGQNYSLTGMHIWNYNEVNFTSRSAGAVEILVSSTTNVGDLVRLDNAGSNFLFAAATGQPDDAGFDLDLSDVTNPRSCKMPGLFS